MSTGAHPEVLGEVRRLLGRVSTGRPGPTLLVSGGIHGNEPAGVLALLRVLGALDGGSFPVRGEMVCLAGNLQALARSTRYIAKDLNRQWTREKVEALRRRPPEEDPDPEDREQREMLASVEEVLANAAGEVFFLDLHTCSADSSPFVTLGDTLRNRRFASRIPLPVVLGLEEQVDGSLLEYLNNLGCVTLGAEGGRHEAASSVDHLEAVVWFALVSAGLLRRSEVPDLPAMRGLLREASSAIPRLIEVTYRHPVGKGDGFEMEPGFANIEVIAQGQVLARDHGGEIRARRDGLLMLPRYQGKGNDGFFLAREVNRYRLEASLVLRRLGLGRLAVHLPGVRHHPDDEGTLVVNTRIARFLTLDVFHLLGYRKVRREGRELHVTRRRFDISPPPYGILREARVRTQCSER